MIECEKFLGLVHQYLKTLSWVNWSYQRALYLHVELVGLCIHALVCSADTLFK